MLRCNIPLVNVYLDIPMGAGIYIILVLGIVVVGGCTITEYRLLN